MKKILILIIFFSAILPGAELPYSSGRLLSSYLDQSAVDSHMIALSSSYGKNLLEIENGSDLIKTYVYHTLSIQAAMKYFDIFLSFNGYSFVDGAVYGESEAQGGFADSAAALLIHISKEKSYRISAGPVFFIPSGDRDDFTGEGVLRGGILLSGDYSGIIDSRSYLAVVGRKEITSGELVYSTEITGGLTVSKDILYSDFMDARTGLRAGLLFSTDAADMFSSYHSMLIPEGAIYFRTAIGECSLLIRKGIGKYPYTPDYEASFVIAFYNIF